MLKLFVGLVAALLIGTGPAVAWADEFDGTVKVAYIDPLSGSMAMSGQLGLDHLKFFAKQINADGGIAGKKLEIIGLDNKVSPQETLLQLQKAVDNDVHYVIQGLGSSAASALVTAIEKNNRRNPDHKVVFLNYAAVDPIFTNERCSFWHFRFDAHVDMKMNALTSWMEEEKGIKKVYMINQDYSLGHSAADAARRMLKEKRPDIEIVGFDFHSLGKVKDFSPYISKIRAAGADAVITSNWGQDITLLLKAAGQSGLKVPFLTFYGSTPGVATQIGEKGIGNIYEIHESHGDYDTPELVELQVGMKKETGWDYYYPRLQHILRMLKKAADQAGSADPEQVAFAMEDMSLTTPTGEVLMRKDDHQLQMPMFISVMKGDMKYGLEKTDLNFHKVARINRETVSLPTTCQMRRPQR